eukprot:g12477.t1
MLVVRSAIQSASLCMSFRLLIVTSGALFELSQFGISDGYYSCKELPLGVDVIIVSVEALKLDFPPACLNHLPSAALGIVHDPHAVKLCVATNPVGAAQAAGGGRLESCKKTVPRLIMTRMR